MCSTRLLPVIALGLSAIACSKSEASAEPKTDNLSRQSVGDGSSYENATYKVRLEAPPSFKIGEQAVARIVLETKGDYHINKQYPYKFVIPQSPANGLSYPKPTVTREDGVFEERKAVISVPFVASQTGEAKISGIFSLSVCTDANCLLDKRNLELSVHAQ
jgi:hypothetical protein